MWNCGDFRSTVCNDKYKSLNSTSVALRNSKISQISMAFKMYTHMYVCTFIGIGGGTRGGAGGPCPPTHHKGGAKNVYVEYYMHGRNCNINHEFSTMAFRPPTCRTIPPPMICIHKITGAN